MKKEYVKMIVTLTLIATVCGFLLTAVKTVTQTKIEEQILVNVKGPALKKVLRQSTNDPIENRMDVNVDGISHTVFIGKKGEKIWAIAYESEGKGFGGKIGVMIGLLFALLIGFNFLCLCLKSAFGNNILLFF